MVTNGDFMGTYINKDKVLVAVDCIIFGFDPQREVLQLLLIKRDFKPKKGRWSLMGGFMKKHEDLREAAVRVLTELTGLDNIYLEQLKTFGKIDRDPVERTVSVAYSALINTTEHDSGLINQYSARWFDISEVPDLIFDHDFMVKTAIKRLQYRASVQPIGFELLPEKFTMRQLQKLYEEIFNQKLDKRNFIKKINSLKVLEKLKEKDMTSSRKGSFLYRFNHQKYQEKLKAGFVFKV
ncbi:MAG: DNA mismatch repair protein MutT [Cyclobacteriaceae bacterium]|nr:MAG: DNA mismatch repair protein MutT [Cyclobacteriaceae bacterium]